MTKEEFIAEAEKWDLEDYTTSLVFSDWLLEHGAAEYANMVKWCAIGRKQSPAGWYTWKDRLDYWKFDPDMPNYDTWKSWAEGCNHPILK